MESIFIIQLIGVILAAAGWIALIASAHLFGIPMSPAERQRAGDEWNQRKKVFRLPLTIETILSSIFFFAGIGILIWADFNLCAFLAYWLPPLPEMARQVLSCQ